MHSAHGILSKGAYANPEDIEQERAVAFFLASQNSIRQLLVDSLRKIDGYSEVVVEVINECVSLLETGQHILPDERHRLLKVRER